MRDMNLSYVMEPNNLRYKKGYMVVGKHHCFVSRLCYGSWIEDCQSSEIALLIVAGTDHFCLGQAIVSRERQLQKDGKRVFKTVLNKS